MAWYSQGSQKIQLPQNGSHLLHITYVPSTLSAEQRRSSFYPPSLLT